MHKHSAERMHFLPFIVEYPEAERKTLLSQLLTVIDHIN